LGPSLKYCLKVTGLPVMGFFIKKVLKQQIAEYDAQGQRKRKPE